MTDVTVVKCCWVVTVNRQTREASAQLWDDDETAWQRSFDIERENPRLFPRWSGDVDRTRRSWGVYMAGRQPWQRSNQGKTV